MIDSYYRHVCHLLDGHFRNGLSYTEILQCLRIEHGIDISKRTLHRVLRHGRLFRRQHFSDLFDVAIFIIDMIQQQGSCHGYRSVHAACLRYGFTVSRDDVRLLLAIVDSYGVSMRAKHKLQRRQYFSRGPNWLWHLDGYDKSKPFGLCIHGAIDGFSRNVIWLNVYKTNNDPGIISGYCMEAVKSLRAMPRYIRTDFGTENGVVEIIQRSVVDNNSYIYGTSTSNQRIESYWSVLRKSCIQHWINFFEDLKDNQQFTGSALDKGIVQYCFTEIVQVANMF